MRPLLIFLALISVAYIPTVNAIEKSDVESRLGSAYSLVAKAEANGGDVLGLVKKLNEAASFVNIGDPISLNKALSLILEVEGSIRGVEDSGAMAVTYRNISIAASLAMIAVIGTLIYFYGSRVFWSLWLRSRKGWRAEAT
jgi:hypothetical protein